MCVSSRKDTSFYRTPVQIIRICSFRLSYHRTAMFVNITKEESKPVEAKDDYKRIPLPLKWFRYLICVFLSIKKKP